MKKNIILLGALVVSSLAYSQVGINNESPKATLDVSKHPTDTTKPEGIIAPRLAGNLIQGKDAQYGTLQTGAIIYATDASPDAGVSGAKTINITGAGYYYFDGAIWQKFNSGAASAGTEPWYDAATQTPATLNDQDIYQMGKVGIGTTTPEFQLDIFGDNASPTVTERVYSTGRNISQVYSNPDATSAIYNVHHIRNYSNVAGSYGSFNLEKYRGSVASPTAVLQNDRLGNFQWYGHNGTTTQLAAAIYSNATSDWSGASKHADIIFATLNSGVAGAGANEKMRLSSTGYLGIGTNAPTQPLQVVRETPAGGSYGTGIGLWEHNNNTTSNAGAIFSTFFSKGTHVAPADLSGDDVIGTYNFQFRAGGNWSGGNNSKLFSTYRGTGADLRSDFQFFTVANTATGAKPRMTIDPDGDVGIGEINDPTNKLHVLSPGGTADPVRIEGLQTGAATDAIVVATSTGVLKTIPASSVTSTINTVLGVMGAGTGRTVSTADDSVNEYYKTGAYIDLPPGKWAVNVVMLMTPSIRTPYTEVTTPNDSSFWVRTSFVDTDPGTSAVTISATSPYIQGSYYISGNLPGASVFSFAQGTMVINNTGTVSHRYYYIAGGVASRNTTLSLNQFGNYQWAEDQIIAYKIN